MHTLMIVDDEQLERQALRFIIEKDFPSLHIVGEAGDGISAIGIAKAEKPDIVLMDIRMPELNGLEATKVIRESLPDAAVIMLTAFDDFEYAKQALSAGAVEYLLKPLRPSNLLETLQSVALKVEQRKRKLREESQLRKSIAEAMPFIKMSFVYDLILGNISDDAHYRERAQFLGINADPGVAIVADISNFKQLTQGEAELHRQVMKQKLYRHICSVLGPEALVAPFGGDDIVILLAAKGYADTDAIKSLICETAKELKEAVARCLGIDLTIAIGRYYQEPLEIAKSYLEALSVLRQRHYLGDNNIMHIEDLPHLNTVPLHYPFHDERNLLDKVRCGERKEAKEELRQLLNEIFSARTSLDTVKACVLELLIVLSRAAVEGGANVEQLTLLNFNSISQLNSCKTAEAIRHWLLDALDRYMDNMLENRTSMNSRVINKACDYILKNCHKNLSLEEVAQMAHLSSFYFSRLFKAEKGCNFVEFLTKARIDKAKRQLQNPDQTVVRIALECGYQDASYFCRVFRQEVGLTPNQYRNSLKEGKKTP